MTCEQLILCCCCLLFVAGCGDEAGTSEQGRPTSGSADRNGAMLLIRDFMDMPLEGVDEDSDSRAYRHVCEKAEAVAGEIWKLSGDPDMVIDFWITQRKIFDAEAKRCEDAFRRALEMERGMVQSGKESRRFHNLKCLYLYPLELSDEHVLMEVVSNKFFSVDRDEFDKCMAHLRKAIGRNFGHDEQLRLLHPNRK